MTHHLIDGQDPPKNAVVAAVVAIAAMVIPLNSSMTQAQYRNSNSEDAQTAFEDQRVKKRQTRITGMNEQILTLYAKEMSTSDITTTFQKVSGAGN